MLGRSPTVLSSVLQHVLDAVLHNILFIALARFKRHLDVMTQRHEASVVA